jgi:hypothetical protein
VSLCASLTEDGPLFAVHAAIAARLAQAFPPGRFHHEILPAAVTPSMWADLARRTPLIALGFVGLRPERGGRHFEARAEWRVVPVLRNPAGARPRLLGDRQGPGQFGLLQVAIAALHGLQIPGWGTAEITEATNLYAEGYADEHAALSGITVSVRITLVPAPAAGALDEFLRQSVRWAFDPDRPDAATDTLNLREAP